MTIVVYSGVFSTELMHMSFRPPLLLLPASYGGHRKIRQHLLFPSTGTTWFDSASNSRSAP